VTRRSSQIRTRLALILTLTFGTLAPSQAASADQNLYTDVAEAKGDVKFRFTLDRSVPWVGGTVAHAAGFRGANQTVVVLDTGVETSHPALRGRIVQEACFSPSCPNGSRVQVGPGAAAPVHWHGTHVAGIVAGSATSIVGVAPKANIIAVNVFDRTGAAWDSDVVAALNWVAQVADTYNVVAVNMSLGTNRTFRDTCDGYIPELTDAIRTLRDKKVATVISSGNSYAIGMSSPACITYSVSVASTEVQSDSISDFSNISERTTIAAPGRTINSAATGGGYRVASGTSMSAPHVAGAFALYAERYGRQDIGAVVTAFSNGAPKARDSYSGISIPRLSLGSLFAGSPVPVPPTTPTTIPSTTLPGTPTTIPGSPPTTRPPFLPTVSRPILLDLYGGYVTSVYVKYRVPISGRGSLSHYNLYCNGSSSPYRIPTQQDGSVQTYRLEVPARNINWCVMSAVDTNGAETETGSRVNIYPRNR